MAGLQPFNYGNAIAQAEMIKSSQEARNPNSLNNLYKQAQLNALSNKGSGIDIGQVNPRDFTAQSISQFKKTGDFNVLERHTPKKSAIKVNRGDKIEFYHPHTNELLKSMPTNLAPDKEPGYIENVETIKSEATQKAKFKWGPSIIKAQKEAEATAKANGEAFTDLNRMKASMPGLKTVIGNLTKLSDSATYTLFGQGFDWATKQLGFGATKGATDRAKFESIVDNQVLPLLRQTFGAAFTAAEGDRLRATLGDVNKTPSEKKASLDAFIEQKVRDVEAKQAEINLNSAGPGLSPTASPDLTAEEQAELDALEAKYGNQ